MGLEVFALDHAPIIDNLSLSERVVALEEVEEQVHTKIQNHKDINGSIKALGLELVLEEMRSEGQRQRNLQFYDIEHEEVEEIPS